MYEYSAKMVRVIDGDTIQLDIDLGFSITRREIVRLYGINTPEMSDKDSSIRAKAQAAKELLILSTRDKQLLINTIKDKEDKYGRMLAIIFVDGHSVNQQLIEADLAMIYYP